MRWSAVLLAALPLLAACSSHRGGDARSAASRRAALIYSPNGEPLSGGVLGHPSCTAALSGWFERVDTNHDGAIDRAEFLADARRQFAAMDLDKDGTITPSELARYRLPFLSGGTGPAAAAADTSGDASRRGRRGQGQAQGGSNDGGAIPEDRPDPVMLADVELRNQVSRTDFLAYEDRNFSELDTDRDGRLTRAGILRSCPPDDGS